MNHAIESLLLQYGEEQIIKSLAPFLSDHRREKIDDVLTKRLSSLRIAVESPSDIHNVLAIVRTAEAFGLSHLDLIHPRPKTSGKRSSMGAQKWTHIHYHDEWPLFHQTLPPATLLIAAVCDAPHSIDEIPVDQPLCILFGNEHAGLSKEALAQCSMSFSLPLFGFSNSLNLSVAAGIVIYHLTSKYRQKALCVEKSREMEKEKARFFMRSLGTSLSKKILERIPLS